MALSLSFKFQCSNRPSRPLLLAVDINGPACSRSCRISATRFSAVALMSGVNGTTPRGSFSFGERGQLAGYALQSAHSSKALFAASRLSWSHCQPYKLRAQMRSIALISGITSVNAFSGVGSKTMLPMHEKNLRSITTTLESWYVASSFMAEIWQHDQFGRSFFRSPERQGQRLVRVYVSFRFVNRNARSPIRIQQRFGPVLFVKRTSAGMLGKPERQKRECFRCGPSSRILDIRRDIAYAHNFA